MRNYVLIITMHADPAMSPGYSEWGGTHTYMRELLDELNANKVNSILITRHAIKELPSMEFYHSHCVIIRLQNGQITPMDKTLLRNYHEDNLTHISRIIEAQETLPLVIHSVYWNSGRLGMELSKKYGIPFVHSVISNSRGRVMRGAVEPIENRAEYEQAIFDAAKWILCVSNDEKNDLERFYNISPDKLIVAGQYIHPSFISPAHDPNGFPRLYSSISSVEQGSVALRFNEAYVSKHNTLFWANKAFTYFGRIDKSKGVDSILCAWYQAYKRNLGTCPPLWLIGGSVLEIENMRSSVFSEIKELPELERQGKIVWWGCLDPAGASALLLKTLVLLTNSLYEPGGRVLVEAMSEGVPVIASPNGFAADSICNWKNGFLVKYGDISTLSQRMEHFIRQPFLSNALGLNAKETALNVIGKWDFTQKHLWTYGLVDHLSHFQSNICTDYFKRGEIHLFPYQNNPFSISLLTAFFEKQTGEHILSEPKLLSVERKSEVYQIEGENGKYIIKHPISRLAISPLFNPIQKHRYVRNSAIHYNYEKMAYIERNDNVLVGYDDFHHLLLLKELNLHEPTLEELPSLIKYLVEQSLPLSRDKARLFRDILFNHSMREVEDIESVLDKLSSNFPNYYFESSCFFSPYVAWKAAPHLISYNASIIEPAQVNRLSDISRFFSDRVFLPAEDSIVEINTDTEMRHICKCCGQWKVIDRENRAIGTIECEIADLFFDIFCHSEDDSFNIWCVLLELVSGRFDCFQIVSSIAYRIFYDTILHIIMMTGSVEKELSTMEFLIDFSKQL